MRSYTGSQPCAGCGKTGKEESRHRIDSLCWKCQETLRKGKAIDEYDALSESFVSFRQHYHAFRNPEVNVFCHKLLESLSIKSLSAKSVYPIGFASGDNCKHYTIPAVMHEPLKEFFKQIDEKISAIKEDEKWLPNKIESAIQLAVNQERNKIFNEGADYGRSLLLQLNSGEITLDKFNEKITKY